MSGGHLRSDHDRLTEHGRRFGEFSERAGAIIAELKSTLDGHGECWGTDEVGQSFAAGHQEHAARALDHAGGLAGRLSDVGTTFTDVAAGYRQADEQGVEALRSAGGLT